MNTENRILTKCEQDLVRTGTVRHPGENRRSVAMKKKILAVCLAAGSLRTAFHNNTDKEYAAEYGTESIAFPCAGKQ